MKKTIFFAITHMLFASAGFVAGIYALPILTAPEPPSVAELDAVTANAEFTGQFRRDLKGSDFLHWGEGTVSVGRDAITLQGRIAPGPDYKLYLSPEFVETEADFTRLKPNMVLVGDVKTFDNFMVHLPQSVEPGRFNTVIIWCESFGEFITAASYK
jgi:hypothetical protein